ncbi:hypothetical protein M2222_000969 [Bradyrhizobium elkanii]|nr:hypothetical protein [Bradyrhizobium elkanii]MCW2151506.1 hypothetical protein [Bradyrhizobium elkanii]MCW2358621.1 hypothetical protein [Bradyrhizobium elkanii]MCW2375237.1 hypothetical protein [Bradyrhizobium elkanii]
MKQKIARRRNRVMHAANFPKRVQILRSRGTEQPVPDAGADAHDARQPPLQIAEADGAQQRRQVRAETAYGGVAFRSGIDRHDQEDGRPRETRDDRLRNSRRHTLLLW